MKKNLLILFITVLALNVSFSQNEISNWYCAEYNICIQFEEDGIAKVGDEDLMVKYRKKGTVKFSTYLSPGDSRKTVWSKYKIIDLTDNGITIKFLSGVNYLDFPKEDELKFAFQNSDCP